MKNCNWFIFRNNITLKLLIPVFFLALILSGFSAFSAVFRKAPYLLYPKSNAKMEIYWQLDGPASCTLNYGTTTAYGSTVTTAEYGGDHQHKFQLAGLDANTKYYYRVNITGGSSVTGSFRTGADDNASEVTFYAYGDTRSQPVEHNKVCEQVVADFTSNPANQTFIIVSGDLVNNGDSETDWDAQLFSSAYPKIREIMGSLPYMASMGNHEGNGTLFAKYFPYQFYAGNDERYNYSFDYGPVHFTIIDQYIAYTVGSAQYNWIVSDLSSSTKPWKFILLHEPGWSAGGGHGNNATVQSVLQPLAETYGVQFFIAGHNHYYARATVNNVQHITAGGGGAPLHIPVLTYPNVIKADKSFNFCKINISGNRLDFTATRSDGTPIETFTLYRNGPVIPTFNQIGPLCQSSAPPTFPLVSTNGISGTWSPSTISTGTPGSTVYTFTPANGQNAEATTMSVTINPLITPAFVQIGPFNQGTVPSSLPGTSSNGIAGTWNPAVISTAAVGTFSYIFMPNPGECAGPVTIQVEIRAKVPPVVQITTPVSGTIFTAPANITVSAVATDPDGTIDNVAFYQGTTFLGIDYSYPYSYTWTAVPEGNYGLKAVATDNDGLVTTSAIIDIAVNSTPLPVVFENRIQSGSDDVEEYNSGTMSLADTDLDLVYDSKSTGNQKVGLRFRSVAISQGANVTKAYVQFTSDKVTTNKTTLLIQGQNADNADAFSTKKKNVSGRAKTVATVSWAPSEWSALGASGSAQETPDLKSIVQEIINRPNWISGNNMAFIISGTGTRTAKSWETTNPGGSNAALLHVEFTTPGAGSNSLASGKSAVIRTIQGTKGILTCYPVPFTDVLNISFEPADHEMLQHIAIFNITGNLMKKIQTGDNELSIGLEGLSPGVYLIEAQTDCNRYIKTIIKK